MEASSHQIGQQRSTNPDFTLAAEESIATKGWSIEWVKKVTRLEQLQDLIYRDLITQLPISFEALVECCPAKGFGVSVHPFSVNDSRSAEISRNSSPPLARPNEISLTSASLR